MAFSGVAHNWPEPQGLYDPQFEHDACGMGFVVHMKGHKSHQIVQNGLEILVRLDHRGASGAEVATGDGAGILMQIPHGFFQAVCGMDLPEPGQYGVGMIFLPRDDDQRRSCEEIFERIVAEEGQQVLGWRDVPTDGSMLGSASKSAEPTVRQILLHVIPTLKKPMVWRSSASCM
jgi:glutamate synthase (ferredoxin)